MSDIAWKNLPPELAASFRPAGPPRWLVALLGCLVAGAYLACVHGQWWPTSDSALYVGLGRSLLDGNGYQFNGEFCNEVTPGLPWLYAVSQALGGEHSFWLCHLAVTAAALGTLWLIYAALSRLTDRTLALAVTLITAGSKIFFHHANQFLTDVPFMVFYWGMIYASVRYLQAPRWRYLAMAGVLVALGMVVRVPGLTVVGPLALGVLLQVGGCIARRPSLAGASGGAGQGWPPPTNEGVPPQAGAVKFPRRFALAATLMILAGGVAAIFTLLAHQGVQVTPPYLAHAKKSFLDFPILWQPWDGFRGLAIVLWPIGSDPETAAKSLDDNARVLLGLAMLAVGCLGMLRMLLRRQILLPVTLLFSVLVLLAIRDMTTMPARYLMSVGPIMALTVLCGLLWIVQAIFIAARWLARRTPEAARESYRSAARLFRRSKETSATFRFDIEPICSTATNLPSAFQNSKSKPGGPKFSLGPTATGVTAALLVCLSVAANGAALSQRFLQHAYYGHTDQFLLHVGTGSFQGLTKMANMAKAVPPGHGPVTCLYPDYRILHLWTGRVMAYPQPGKDPCDTVDDLRAFMDRKGSNYLVVGDEDETENNKIVRQLVKKGVPLTVDFRQVAYDNSCYFFERTTPASAEAPNPSSEPSTNPSTEPSTTTAP